MRVHFIKFLNIFKKKKITHQSARSCILCVCVDQEFHSHAGHWMMFDRFTLHHLCPCVCLLNSGSACNQWTNQSCYRACNFYVICEINSWPSKIHELADWQLLKYFTADQLAMIIYLSPYLPRHNLRQSSPGLPSYQQSAFTWGGK